MSKFAVLLTLSCIVFCTLSLALADTLTAKVNQAAYDYASAMFKTTEVSVGECAAEQKERTGFFYICGTTTLEGNAFETAWTAASREYGSTDLSGEMTAEDAWESNGSGGQMLEVVVDDEFIVVDDGADGAVSVQSGQTF